MLTKVSGSFACHFGEDDQDEQLLLLSSALRSSDCAAAPLLHSTELLDVLLGRTVMYPLPSLSSFEKARLSFGMSTSLREGQEQQMSARDSNARTEAAEYGQAARREKRSAEEEVQNEQEPRRKPRRALKQQPFKQVPYPTIVARVFTRGELWRSTNLGSVIAAKNSL